AIGSTAICSAPPPTQRRRSIRARVRRHRVDRPVPVRASPSLVGSGRGVVSSIRSCTVCLARAIDGPLVPPFNSLRPRVRARGRNAEKAMTIKGRQLHPLFVGEVSGLDLVTGVSPQAVAELARAIDRYAVLVFHGQSLDDDQLLALGRLFWNIE